MSDVFRLMALDGPVVGVGVLVALAWLTVRLESTRTENVAAQAAIAKNIDVVREQTMPEDERRRLVQLHESDTAEGGG